MIKGLFFVSSIPIIMLIVSFVFYKFPPKTPNNLYGYRTNRSQTNEKVWKEANKYYALIQLKLSLIYFSISIFLIGITIEYNNLFWFTYWTILCLLVPLFAYVFIKTESHLKKFIDNEKTLE